MNIIKNLFYLVCGFLELHLNLFPKNIVFAKLELACFCPNLLAKDEISVSTDISVLGFYGYIGYIGDILVDIFT